MKRQIGRYEVTGEIGRGGAGVVLRGRSPEGDDVAIKLVRRDRLNADALARFEREQRLLRTIEGGNGFVPLLDAGDSPEGPYFVMPFLGGGTLRMRLLRGTQPIGDTVAILRSLALSIGRAHKRGIVHRDLKPENVIFDDAGRPLIADLGLAKHYRRDVAGARGTQFLTVTDQSKGTPGYMPPEQLTGIKDLGPTADVYALGAIAYECLAGKPAFEGENLIEVVAKSAQGIFTPLAEQRRDCPPWLATLVERSLALDPKQRPADGQAFVDALSARSGEAPRGREGTVVVAGLAAVLVALVVVALSLVLRRAPEPVPAPAPEPPATAPAPASPPAPAPAPASEGPVSPRSVSPPPLAEPTPPAQPTPPGPPARTETPSEIAPVATPSLPGAEPASPVTPAPVAPVAPVASETPAPVGSATPVAPEVRPEKPAAAPVATPPAAAPTPAPVASSAFPAACSGFLAGKTTRLTRVLGSYDWTCGADASTAVTFSPDGRLLVASGGGGTMAWDIATGEVALRVQNAPGGRPAGWLDDRWLLLLGNDSSFRKIDTKTGAAESLASLVQMPYRIAFSPDVRRAALVQYTAQENGTLAVIDIAAPRKLVKPRWNELVAFPAAIAITASHVVAADMDSTLHVWRAPFDRYETSVLRPKGVLGQPLALWIDPAGTTASLLTQGHVGHVDLKTGRVRLTEITPGHGPPKSGVFSDDGRRLLVSYDANRWTRFPAGEVIFHPGRVELAETLSGGAARILDEPIVPVESMALSRDGRWAAASMRGGVRIYGIDSARPAPAPATWRPAVDSLAVSPDGARIIVGRSTGEVDLIDTLSGATQRTERPVTRSSEPGARRLSYGADGPRVLLEEASATGPSLRLVDFASGKTVWREATTERTMALSADGRWCLLAAVERRALRDAKTGRLAGEIGNAEGFSGTVGGEGRALVWTKSGLVELDLGRGKTGRRYPDAGPRGSPAIISADGRQALVNNVHLDLVTGKTLRRFEAKWLNWATFAPDMRSAVAFAGTDSFAIVDLATGLITDQVKLQSAHDEPRAMAYSADGKSLFVGTALGVVLRFEVGAR